MTFSPPEPSSKVQLESASLSLNGLIDVLGSDTLRAIQPEPHIKLILNQSKAQFTVNNIATEAALSIDGLGAFEIDESINGISRLITIQGPTGEAVELNWLLPSNESYTFAVIGDSGGGDELSWCLERAHELGAQFLLHLGDFNYAPDEYDQAIHAFYTAEIPSYITIGNHDFNDSGLVYQNFLNELGRFNHRFMLAGTEFLNIDTAASFFPLSGGQRGRFMRSLTPTSNPKIAFTHRPFVDIRPGEDHVLSSDAEADWLLNNLRAIGCEDYLCGHVHKSGETDVQGLRQWTVGEGLGYEDWVARRPVSQLLMGSIAPDTQPRFYWADLQMPWIRHTSHEHLEKLRKEQPQAAVDWFLAKKLELGMS